MTSRWNKSGWLLPVFFISFICSVAYSYPIWWISSSSFFPAIPFVDWISNVPLWIDHSLLILFLGGVTYGILRKENRVGFHLVILALFVLLCEYNVSRIQPWSVFFMGSFFILLSPGKHQLRFLHVFVVGFYVWSGIFKFSSWYTQNVVTEIDLALQQLLSIETVPSFLHYAVSWTPHILLLATLLSFVGRLKKWVAVVFILYHVTVILVLGIWRNNPNYVIWPWNISLILFWVHTWMQKPNNERLRMNDWMPIQEKYIIVLCVAWVYIFPITWFTGRISSTSSFHLYSGLHREAFIPEEVMKKTHTSIWYNKKLYYSIGVDYLQTTGVPFPDAPDNFTYVIKKWKGKGYTMLMEQYQMDGSIQVIPVSR